ncbi:MAG: C39 family peptidase [Oscillospiraceae bacterium]|nr:C39 family peptidase [Oscillospiraceae bacterium]
MKKFAVIVVIVVVAIFATSLFIKRQEPKNEKQFLPQEKEKMIEVEGVCQYPELPTGCESAAAVTVMRYYGADITAAEFARNLLESSRDFYSIEGVLHGPNPNEVFAGDPFSENAYGCFAEPIVKAVNKSDFGLRAVKITHKTLAELCKEYIDKDKPLLIWATMSMKPSKNGKEWVLPSGESFTWISGEHTLVLVGYDDEYYFFKDSQSGSTVGYEKAIAEKRFLELGSQAVYIDSK